MPAGRYSGGNRHYGDRQRLPRRRAAAGRYPRPSRRRRPPDKAGGGIAPGGNRSLPTLHILPSCNPIWQSCLVILFVIATIVWQQSFLRGRDGSPGYAPEGGLTMEQGSGPVTLRRKVGITLRAQRIKAGVTPQQAADCLYCHATKISRIERGDAPLREPQVRALLDLYGVAAAEAEGVLADVRATNRQPWWHQFQDAVPGWARGYLGMEAEASTIRCYAPYTVPDLFQTSAYADSLAKLPSRLDQETARLREMRAGRQAVVRGHGRVLQAVIDESALLRATGGPDVMREQCASLVQAAKEPGVSIRILRLSTGAHRDGGIPFTLLRFADPALQDVAYVETPVTGIYAERPDDLDVYRELATRLELAAEPASATPDILAGLW
jgi:hypothetical protein